MPLRRRSLLAGLAGIALHPRLAHAFTPPGKAARRAAIGPLDDLTREERRAFALTDDVAPTPRPGPDDWLTAHREPGQTFAQFLKDRPNRLGLERHTIVLQPIGPLGDGCPALNVLVDFANRFFGMPAVASPTLTVASLRARSRVRGHRQLRTGDLLDGLARRLPKQAYCLIGVTQDDLYPGPAWNFVFGEARLHERVGVYSFARYDPAFHGQPRAADTATVILRRGFKLMAHEIGHMFAIEHCVHSHCIMNGTNTLDETDRSPSHPCPMCLRKLHEVVGFDLVKRERRLSELYRGLGLGPEADACDARLARLVAA